MLLPHFVRVKDCNKTGRCRRLLHARSSACFLALNQAHHADNLETEISGGFNRLNRRSSRGTNIIYDYDPCPFFPEALNSLSRTVLLLRLTDQKSVHLAAGDRYRRHNGVSTQGKSADGLWLPPLRSNLFQKNLPCQARAFAIKCSGATVHVIVAAGAR